MNQNQPGFMLGVLIGAAVVGLVCGLVPLILGFMRGRPVLGVSGFVSCVGAGLLLGCLGALPVALVFGLIIGLQPAANARDRDDDPDDYDPPRRRRRPRDDRDDEDEFDDRRDDHRDDRRDDRRDEDDRPGRRRWD